MDASTLVATLQAAVPGAEIEPVDSLDLHATCFVPAGRLIEVMRTLREHPECGFDFLADITANDVHPTEPRFEVVYTLVSTAKRLRARVKVRLPGNDAHLATVSGIWAAANWLEREVWDMFGIVFDGHPDPRRLLMPEDWEGFPLRKDYPVQIRMRPRTGEPLQVTREEFKANIEHDRLARHE